MPIRLIFIVFFVLFSASALAQTVSRGPYLQQQDDDSIIIRWRTDSATDSVVRYGLTSASLNLTETVAGSTNEHTVEIAGLNPLTTYFYSIGNSAGALAGDNTYFFHTSPTPGVATPTRFWVIGDSGTNTAAQTSHVGKAIAVRDAFKTYTAGNPADFMMMLGDNAYSSGTDAEYQEAVFETYPVLLRQLPLWPTLGNHDGYSADSGTESGPYYDIFDLPRAAEVGGYASGTEAYHSWDYGDIHFINLDSYETDRSVGGAMLTWLEADLMMNDKPWVIVIFHHPPYTKGSHDSDTETELVDMRQNALPILEAWGVDLVMSGHSHSYERSYLLDGHYGISDTLNTITEVLDGGDGKVGGDGAYEKPPYIAAENYGAVYAVAGSSGKVSGLKPDAPHEAMYVTLTELGSMVVDINGSELHAVFIDDLGTVRDEFSIHKTPDSSPPLIANARAEDAIHVVVDFTERLDVVSAVTPSNYDIPGLLITAVELLEGEASVRLTTSIMSTGINYVLTVNNVADQVGNAILPDSQFSFYFIEAWTVSFQNGLAPTPAYAGTMDTHIRQATGTVNYGSNLTLEVDGDEPSGTGTDMYILIGWDVSYIPPTADIESARIHFNVTNPGGPYSCYGLLRAWVESEATWNNADSGTSWATAGALASSDRDNTELCSFNAATGSLAIDLNSAGVALVQSWVDGSAGNHGIVISHQTTSDGVDMDSSETAGAINRPGLEVTYSFSTAPNQAPAALFSYSCTGLWCSFTDASTDVDGTTVSWAWDFDDGITSGVQNPLHQFAGDGTYAIALTVTDNDGAVDSYGLNVTVSTTTTSSAIDVAISGGSDDVEEKLSDGFMYMDSTDLELGDDSSTGNGEQSIGLRFNNIGIPHAATITSANITFTGDEASSGSTSVQFYAEDADNATPFSTTAYDLTNRTTTSAVVNWSNIPAWVINGIYPSPDLSTLVQEVVDRPGWVINNSMAFVIPGTGRRTAEAYEGEASSAALLHVEFEGGSCSASRTLVADRWETFALPCDPGVNNQVQQVMSALAATGAYGVTWNVWRFNEGAGTYTKLAEDDALLPGHGYWIYTLNAATINFVGEFNTISGRGLSTEPVNGSYSFVGNYRNETVSWPDVVVLNGGSEVNIAGADPINNAPPPVMFECDMRPAGDDCLVSRKAYLWSGSNYDTFSTEVPGLEGEIPVGQAIFVRGFAPGSALRLPTGLGTSSFGEQAGQVSKSDSQSLEVQAISAVNKTVLSSNKAQQKPKRPADFEPWSLRLVVSSADKQDRGNVLGSLPDSEDGADLYDVEELAPFGSKYLSLTFENPQLPAVNWGYTSDFRAPAKKAKGEWPIRVRASSDVEEIDLRWEVIEGSSRNVWVRDEQTGLEHHLKAGSDYRFQNHGGVNRFSIIVR